jgi:hypothetical protein
MTRALGALAAAATPIAGLALLAPRSFTLVRCFQSLTFGGCSTRAASLPDMLATAPEQAAPLLIGLAALLVLALTAPWAVAGGRHLTLAAIAIGFYGFLIAGASVALGPWLVGPLLLLIAMYASALGGRSREIAGSLLRIGVLTFGAFAAAYLFAQGWALRLGPFPGGGFDSFWLYVALSSAAGVALGVGLAAVRRDVGQIARGMVVAYASFGAAGLVVALGSVAIMYPHGSYVSLGLAALWGVVFWLIVADTIAIAIAMRTVARVRWGSAVRAGIALTLVAVICGIATFTAFGPLAVSGVAPSLLILPNTATEP